MMRYPLLTRVVNQQQLYLRGVYQQVRDRNAVSRHEIPSAELARSITSQFGIDQAVVQRALSILQRRE